jgi:ribonuclease Y
MDIAKHPDLVAAAVAFLLLAMALYGARRILSRAREEAARLVNEARIEADARAKEIWVAAQEKSVAAEEEAERRNQELDARESAVESRLRDSEAAALALDRKTAEMDRRLAAAARAEEKTQGALAKAESLLAEREAALQRVAGLGAEEARAEVMARAEETARADAARAARRIEEEARERARAEALRVVVLATQNVPMREVVESTVTFIDLPSDEMKGRIIGREGRNIRALEHATGIDVIVDDTPRAILVSSFDPVRREVARLAIARLIEDGRIHPARIEETVAKIREEFEGIVEQSGQEAAFALGLAEFSPRLARLVGRMKLRYHHGHNLLQHSVETALIAAHMAVEFGAREDVARRAGLFHELGRVDDSATGHPILASADLAGRHGESEAVVEAIRSLHPDHEPRIVEALLLRTANRISENRPGARKDNLDVFIERLGQMERIALRFPGVVQAYAVRAGKDLRVLVDTAQVSDDRAASLSREIARTIETEASFPGDVRVSVVRETRAIQYAV